MNCYCRLLLTAFLITLILDMGVGPVLIVFGAVNLSKQTSYPSAAWLMVYSIEMNIIYRLEEF